MAESYKHYGMERAKLDDLKLQLPATGVVYLFRMRQNVTVQDIKSILVGYDHVHVYLDTQETSQVNNFGYVIIQGPGQNLTALAEAAADSFRQSNSLGPRLRVAANDPYNQSAYMPQPTQPSQPVQSKQAAQATNAKKSQNATAPTESNGTSTKSKVFQGIEKGRIESIISYHNLASEGVVYIYNLKKDVSRELLVAESPQGSVNNCFVDEGSSFGYIQTAPYNSVTACTVADYLYNKRNIFGNNVLFVPNNPYDTYHGIPKYYMSQISRRYSVDPESGLAEFYLYNLDDFVTEATISQFFQPYRVESCILRTFYIRIAHVCVNLGGNNSKEFAQQLYDKKADVGKTLAISVGSPFDGVGPKKPAPKAVPETPETLPFESKSGVPMVFVANVVARYTLPQIGVVYLYKMRADALKRDIDAVFEGFEITDSYLSIDSNTNQANFGYAVLKTVPNTNMQHLAFKAAIQASCSASKPLGAEVVFAPNDPYVHLDQAKNDLKIKIKAHYPNSASILFTSTSKVDKFLEVFDTLERAVRDNVVINKLPNPSASNADTNVNASATANANGSNKKKANNKAANAKDSVSPPKVKPANNSKSKTNSTPSGNGEVPASKNKQAPSGAVSSPTKPKVANPPAANINIEYFGIKKSYIDMLIANHRIKKVGVVYFYRMCDHVDDATILKSFENIPFTPYTVFFDYVVSTTDRTGFGYITLTDVPGANMRDAAVKVASALANMKTSTLRCDSVLFAPNSPSASVY